MKNIQKEIIEVIKYVPREIIPRRGHLKPLRAEAKGNSIILSCNHCKPVRIKKEITLRADEYQGVGLYLAEGTKYYNLNKKTHHCGEISFSNSYPECILIISKLFSKFGISPRELRWRIGLNINLEETISNGELAEFWIASAKLDRSKARPNGFYFSGNRGKRLSKNPGNKGCLHIHYASTILRNVFTFFITRKLDEAIEERSEWKSAMILKGFFAGDGCVTYSKKHNGRQVEFICHDKILIEKLRKCLQILGLKSIKETWPATTKTHSKALRIYNTHDFRILEKYEILELIPHKREVFKKLLKSLPP
jgi:hypothetical protein